MNSRCILPRSSRYAWLAIVALLAALAGCSLSSSSSGGGGGGGSGAHSVNLTWNASRSSNIVGYNVYRGTVPGSYGLLTSMHSNTSYIDSTVQNGQIYYYVVTAVASDGMESAYSNETQASVP